jgi:hypothetical protein
MSEKRATSYEECCSMSTSLAGTAVGRTITETSGQAGMTPY